MPRFDKLPKLGTAYGHNAFKTGEISHAQQSHSRERVSVDFSHRECQRQRARGHQAVGQVAGHRRLTADFHFVRFLHILRVGLRVIQIGNGLTGSRWRRP